MRAIFFAFLASVLVFALPASAQSGWQPSHAGIGFAPPPGKQWVQMVSSPDLTIRPHVSENLALRFVIQTGLHINSHAPHSQFLIPTTLTLTSPRGLQIANIEYPAGMDYRFRFSPKEALSVYAGEFSLLVPVRAHAGSYTLQGQLHYQACDDRSCNPPKTLLLTLNVTAK